MKVVLGPGEHRLANLEGLEVQGAGRGETFVVGPITASKVVLKGLTVRGGLVGRDLTLEDVEVCEAAGHGCEGRDVLARDVVFRRNGGAGLVVHGRARVQGWLAEHNRGPGVLVFGEALLEGGVALLNGGDGIRFAGEALGEAYGNLCQGNLGHGVAIAGTAMPAIEHQTLRENGGAGIACLDRSGGRIHANTCDGNRLAPIHQGPLARPMWGRNEGAIVGRPKAPPDRPKRMADGLTGRAADGSRRSGR